MKRQRGERGKKDMSNKGAIRRGRGKETDLHALIQCATSVSTALTLTH